MTEYIKNKGTASGSNESGAPRFSMAEYVTGTRYKPADTSAAIAMGRKREKERNPITTEQVRRSAETDFLDQRLGNISKGMIYDREAFQNDMNRTLYPLIRADLKETAQKESTSAKDRVKALVGSSASNVGDYAKITKNVMGTPAQDGYEAFMRENTDYNRYMFKPDFQQYSTQGANIANPSFTDAQGKGLFFGKRPGAAEVGNIVTFSRDNMDAINERLGSDDKSEFVGNALYGYMTDDEVAIYNYILAKEGKKEAQIYLDSIEETLNARYGGKIAEGVEKTKGSILHPFMVAGTATSAGLDQYVSGVKQAFNEYEQPTSATQFAGQSVRQSQSAAGKFAYDAINTLSNMAPSILASYVAAGLGVPSAVTEWIAAGSIGLGSGGNAYKEALAEGRSRDEAKTVATLIGTSEAILSKLLSGIGAVGGLAPSKILPKVAAIEKAIWRVPAAAIVKIGGEEIEEILQLYLEPLYKTLIYGDKYDAPAVGEVAYTALLTLLTTGMLEGGDIMQYRTQEGARNAAGVAESSDQDINKTKQKTGNPSQSVSDSVLNAGGVSGQQVAKKASEAAQAAQQNVPSTPIELNDGTNSTEVMNDEQRAVYLRGGSERIDGANPEVAVRNMESNAGQNQAWQILGRPADRELSEVSYGEAVSAKELGIVGGSDSKTLRVIAGGDTASTIEAKRLAQERGLNLVLFTGDNLDIEDNGVKISARAHIDGDNVYVRADHPRYTADQLMRHEAGHDMIAKGDIDPKSVRDRIAAMPNGGNIDELSRRYAEAYAGSNMTSEEIWDEIICDSLGDMNIFSESETEADTVESIETAKRSAEQETPGARGPPSTGKNSRELDTNIPLSQQFNAENEDIRFSFKDSTGRTLSPGQQEYFKDSKVRDEDGNLKVMYHGTPSGDFTVFKDGSYFTGSKEYADRYQSPSASSISAGKKATAPKTFAVYLDIKKPFDITDPEARDIYINEYIKGGNAMGINPYLSDAEYRNIKTVDWTEGEDLRDFLIENGYDYDGLVLDEGADGGYGDEVSYRGQSYVVFSPEQVKDTDNLNPTDDPDVRFSAEPTNETNQTDSLTETQEAVRTAVREELERMGKEYGWIKAGEKPFRDVQIPRRTEAGKKVSQTVRTILEAQATPDEVLPNIEKMVADGDFSYEVYSDKQAIADAEEKLKKDFIGELSRWYASMDWGVVSKANTAMGWALYNNAVNSGDTNTALTILDKIVKHQRNAAQAVQATRILKKLSPETQLYSIQKTVNGLQEELDERFGEGNAPTIKIDQELAEQFIEAETQEERDEVTRKIYRDVGKQMPSTFRDKWNAWRYLSLLGNFRTHIRNVVGNAGFAPVVAAKNLTATAIESAVNRVSGGKTGRTKSLLGKKDSGLINAAWNDYGNVADVISSGGKYSDFDNANAEIAKGQEVFKTKWLEKLRKKNSELLEAEDVWFSQPHYAAALAGYCKANNISADDIANGKNLDNARLYAIKEAQKATYKDLNAISWLFSRKFSEKGEYGKVGKAANVFMEGVLPFRKTPANILARGLEYSPIGLARGIGQAVFRVKSGNVTAAEAIDNISAGLTGTGLLALGLWMAAEGVVRGAGGEDEKEKEFDEILGYQNYALRIGDKSYTLDWLAPEALPFFVGVNLWEIRSESGERATLSDWLTSITNLSEPLLEMSCLQSLNDMLDAVGYAQSNGLNGFGNVLVNVTTSYLSQAFPTLFGQIERVTEEQRETTYTSKNAFLTNDLQYLFGKIGNKLPFEFQQIPYIDAWGRTESSGNVGERVFNNMFNPSYVSEISESPMEQELIRLYESTSENVFPSRAPKYFYVNNERKDLTAEEYVTYATTRGQSARELITNLTESKGYKKLEDSDKAALIDLAYDLANAKGKMAATDYKPDGWIAKAIDTCKKEKIPEHIYLTCYLLQNDIESLKDKDGDSISNSKGLLIMQAINQIDGLTHAQRLAMFVDFGVGSKVILYDPYKVNKELEGMRGK